MVMSPSCGVEKRTRTGIGGPPFGQLREPGRAIVWLAQLVLVRIATEPGELLAREIAAQRLTGDRRAPGLLQLLLPDGPGGNFGEPPPVEGTVMTVAFAGDHDLMDQRGHGAQRVDCIGLQRDGHGVALRLHRWVHRQHCGHTGAPGHLGHPRLATEMSGGDQIVRLRAVAGESAVDDGLAIGVEQQAQRAGQGEGGLQPILAGVQRQIRIEADHVESVGISGIAEMGSGRAA